MDIILCIRVGCTRSEKGEVIPIYIIIIIIVKKASRSGAEVADTYSWQLYARGVVGVRAYSVRIDGEKKSSLPAFKIRRYIYKNTTTLKRQ